MSEEPAKKRIFYIDDEDFVAKAARFMFIDLGYEAETCCEAEEALDMFRSDPERFDLVMTDHLMPDMSGMELAAELKKIRPDIPVILCTGVGSAIPRDKAAALGIVEIVSKPFNLTGLGDTLARALGD